MSYVPETRIGVRPDTIALWDFDETIDVIAPDASGNGYDATLIDGVVVADECHAP